MTFDFESSYVPEPNTGCWLWLRCIGNGGYGHCARKGFQLAHRYSWALHNGPIPAGMVVCHRCDTPTCVNPDHLFLGTQADNMRDRDRKGRHRTPQGEACARAKLTNASVREIRAALAIGATAKSLAAQYGVSAITICQIRSGHTWAHLI